jgi:hypothetical protein
MDALISLDIIVDEQGSDTFCSQNPDYNPNPQIPQPLTQYPVALGDNYMIHVY